MVMTTSVNIDAKSVSGATLDELTNQIQRRVEVLKETTSNAVTAIAIQTLKSLRAMTPKSKGSIVPVSQELANDELGIAVQECPQYVVSFKKVGGDVKPCIRIGSQKGSRIDLKPWYRITLANMYQGKVFKVILSEGRKEAWRKSHSPYYIVAIDMRSAQLAVEQRYNKIVKRYQGLGKDAMSRAMMLTSSRAPKFQSSEKAKSVLNKQVVVNKNSSGFSSGTTSITVQDNLRFAGKIIGGDSAVNSAMMKACNSTNGYINQWINKHPESNFFGTELQDTPFPPECFGE